jgi:transcriptional regulator with XRE-family HTH domain
MSAAANRLAALREARKWHRTKVAAEFNVAEKTVYRWEVGDTSIPSDFIPHLASMFDVSEAHLMGWDRADSKAPVSSKAASV